MPQKRRWNFLDDDATADINRWLTGLIGTGIYFGFDFSPTANLNLNLVHTSTGFTDTDNDGVTAPNQGLLVTKQGVIVKEDSVIVINGVVAGHATLPRIDTIVCTHSINEVAGGAQALYSIITGVPNAMPVAPALVTPATQVKVGELYIPALTAALTGGGVVWTREVRPLFGGIALSINKAIVTGATGLPESSTASKTEVSYLVGVTGPIQTQLGTLQTNINAKQDTIDAAHRLNANLIGATGNVSNTEFDYLDGVTGAIQTQLNAKQATVVGGASTIVTLDLTINRALVSDGVGKVAISVTSATELSYLIGVTGAIQTQLNNKQAAGSYQAAGIYMTASDGYQLYTKHVTGVWDMDANANFFIAHGLSGVNLKIVGVRVAGQPCPIIDVPTNTVLVSGPGENAGDITIQRKAGSIYDNPAFNAASVEVTIVHD